MIYLILRLLSGLTGTRDDEDVVRYFNDMMDEPIDIQTVSNGKPMVMILCYKRR